jgi:hypothetical protein
LPTLSYRIGTHATFLETMKARLSSSDYPKLAELATREVDDPSIAILDAWATLADVLTFYQERIANEGYLRSATERRSVAELARLVGYQPRPGVASSVYLAYTLDDNFKEKTIIPKGARSQSVPGPGELPQSFETSEDLKAQAKWNKLTPRMTRPQTQSDIRQGDGKNARIYLKGISTNLKPNDPLLIAFSGKGQPEFFQVKEVIPNAAADHTLIVLQAQSSEATSSPDSPPNDLIGALSLPPSVQLSNSLKLESNLKTLFLGSGIEQDRSGRPIARTATPVEPSALLPKTLTGGEASQAATKVFAPILRDTLAIAAANAQVTEKNPIKIYALRVKASLFGHNAPDTPNYVRDRSGMIKVSRLYTPPTLKTVWGDLAKEGGAGGMPIVASDIQMDHVTNGSWIIIDRPIFKNPGDVNVSSGRSITIHEVQNNQIVTMAAHGVPSKTSQLTIDEPWIKELEKEEENEKISVKRLLEGSTTLLRNTIIYAQSEELELAEKPVDEPVCGGTEQLLELDGVYEGLESGRWIIVSGERDIAGTSGIRSGELAMLASVTQNVGTQMHVRKSRDADNRSATTATRIQLLPGDKTRTFIKLANELEYCFKRDTVTIYGNVVKTTHGETRREVLGSGDGAKALQSFTLKQPPLTYVSASNPSGVDSTINVYVNDVRWRETDSLEDLSPTGRNFITKTDDEGKTAVIFGNGRKGARLPTGNENVKAEYRNGIGKVGNVKAGQITLLATKPLGVKDVVNPLRASGGADKESRDQARKNAPLAVKALDRLVSVQDYEDFARIYAGIGKARAVELSDGRRQLVHVTVAGADDIPIDKYSDLYRNLHQALLAFGDPYQAIRLEIRELMLIVISARIRILPEHTWEPVVTQVRSALLDAFSFERRELGQDVLLSEVISVMQSVRGVAYVDVDVLRGIPEKVLDNGKPGQRRLLTPAEIGEKVGGRLRDEKGKPLDLEEPLLRITVNLADSKAGAILPAQLAFLTPDIPESLILNQIHPRLP